MTVIQGTIVDPLNRRTFKGEIHISNGRIEKVLEKNGVPNVYILPGFVDSHIHIESSMLIPSEFARVAVRHGTVATVSDPHEIANVCGMEGVEFMIENGKQVPLKFYFGAPSCVPATIFETAGAELTVEDVRALLQRDEIVYLAEMMNWPGVLMGDADVLAKIKAAQDVGKPVDGHAPGLRGENAETYVKAGISTDHECFTAEEALDKLKHGMKIVIREGSAAKNYDALIGLMKDYASEIMFCSDDKHPDDLLLGHINELVSRTLKLDFDLYDVLHSACVLPVQHYGLNVGLLQPGDPADFILVDNLDSMQVTQTWIDGTCVFDGDVHIPKIDVTPINNFTAYEVFPDDFRVTSSGTSTTIPVIEALDGELITRRIDCKLPRKGDEILADPENDILKIAVVNRYGKSTPGVGFIKNFGLKNGAIASSVGHDSHNIIAIGTSDANLSRVVNLVMEAKGGIAAIHGETEDVLPLPIAGIMTDSSAEEAGKAYQKLTIMAKEMGSQIKAPFMLISFMALLVIPAIKMSDKGLFDAEKFNFIDL